MAVFFFPSEEEITSRRNLVHLLKTILVGSPKTQINPRKDLLFLSIGLYALEVWSTSTVMEFLVIGKGQQSILFDMVKEKLDELNDESVQVDFAKNATNSIELQVSDIKLRLFYIQSSKLVDQWVERGHLTIDSSYMERLPYRSRHALQLHHLTKQLKCEYPLLEARRRACRILCSWASQRGILHDRLGYYGEIQLFEILSDLTKRLVTKDVSHGQGELHTSETSSADADQTQHAVFESLQAYSATLVTSITADLSIRPHVSAEDVLAYTLLWCFFKAESVKATQNENCRLEARRMESINENIDCERNSKYAYLSTDWCKAFVHDLHSFHVSIKNGACSGLQDFAREYAVYYKLYVEYWGVSSGRRRQLVETLESTIASQDLKRRLAKEDRIWPERLGDSIDGAFFLIGSRGSSSIDAIGFSDFSEAYERCLSQNSTVSGTDDDHYVSGCLIQPGDMKQEARSLEAGETKQADIAVSATFDSKPAEQEDSGAKGGMRTERDVMKRINWDSSYEVDDYVVGYLDRIDGIKELPLNAWESEITEEEWIPLHRIRYFKHKRSGDVVWDRTKRIDRIFHSAGAAR